MSKSIWHDCKKQPPLVDDGELVLMDSNDKFWVGFCEITSDGISYFANNAEPLKNDFVKYARIDKLLTLETELERTRKALDVAVDALKSADKYYMYCVKDKILQNASIVAFDMDSIISNALEQITALEQKNHFANASKKVEQKESAFVHNKIEFPEYNDNLLEEFDKQFFENGQDDDLTETALEQKDVK